MPAFVTPSEVRAYLGTVTDTAGQWSEGNLGSNISVASANLQRWTGRQFEAGSNTTTRIFSTLGRSVVAIPDARSISAVRLNSSALTADSSYYAIPDRMNTGVYTSLEIPSGRADYRAYADWFDRGLDNWYWRNRQGTPNDLEVDALWGPAVLPDEVKHATKVLAAWYSLRSDALLSGVKQTPEGNVFDLSKLPVEVRDFVDSWKLSDMFLAVG